MKRVSGDVDVRFTHKALNVGLDLPRELAIQGNWVEQENMYTRAGKPGSGYGHLSHHYSQGDQLTGRP